MMVFDLNLIAITMVHKKQIMFLHAAAFNDINNICSYSAETAKNEAHNNGIQVKNI